jgi:hypothetical protein
VKCVTFDFIRWIIKKTITFQIIHRIFSARI